MNQLLDLPPEIFGEVVETFVRGSTLNEVFPLRLVSRRFNIETVRAICSTRALHRLLAYKKFGSTGRIVPHRVGQYVLTEYLLWQTLQDGSVYPSSVILQTVDDIISFDPDVDRKTCIRMLCDAAAEHGAPLNLFRTPKRFTQQFASKEQNLLAAGSFIGHEAIVYSCLENGTNRPTAFGSPLLCAIAEGHTPIVRMLLRRGFWGIIRPDLTSISGLRFNVFFERPKPSHPEILLSLVDPQFSYAITQKTFEFALVGAAGGGYLPEFKRLLKLARKRGLYDTLSWDLTLNGDTYNGISRLYAVCLLYSAAGGHEQFVAAMMKKVHPKFKSRTYWISPLGAAAAHGQYEVMRQLIDAGAMDNSNAAGYYRDVLPITHAVKSGSVRCLQILIDNGADVNSPCGPLKWAMKCGRRQMVDILLKHGAKVGR
ncbi:ankyrin [Eremomyces bilateralis CBS 781.70]|uniref:Ankyrin n=1 Tax=Eremomyces bilateralis CBS 781.70 TaxID=1392243 RepID=A0A6G1G6X7_9PEZI|nr:ankyrin [Eremomyces bilateralis CBS 781.70]KAF1813784.1 ankyrin [Eremomyces bilateralis CBS 781.70]